MEDAMVTGRDIREFRRQNQLKQVEFAQQLGVAQPTLSQLEQGLSPVSDEYIARLTSRFDGGGLVISFSDFRKEIESQRAIGQAALHAPDGQFTMLKVFTWQDFDLARVPGPEQAVDMIVVRPTTN